MTSVTGASSGFGRLLTEIILAKGEIALATARRPEALQDLVPQYPMEQLLVVKLDVTKPAEISSAFAAAKEAFGRIDVVVNNAAFAALEKWKLGPADLHPLNPSLIFTRVSGYGQTGPWSSRPGYASVCEAESGFRYVNGTPDPHTGGLLGPPIRPNLSLGDSVAGLHAAFGTVGVGVACAEGEGGAGSAGRADGRC
ncbi:hypothetical protein NUW54_g11400 [Trametes sanguinea]|uniref:Uncharacterized protein n=1 Tax=Trametes sanguinea TaxID=158606 RepID=A0ACC1NE96_9APHY|nr:hypothetical protein NUW54_g11400 [Trametes sanguinea]